MQVRWLQAGLTGREKRTQRRLVATYRVVKD